MGARKLLYHAPLIWGNKEIAPKKMALISKGNTSNYSENSSKNCLDYFPYGMLLPNRHEAGNEYRYGFNGYEKDDEVSGEGNSLNSFFRQYDPRLGRFKSIDPMSAKFPWQSPYVGFDNNPILYPDPSGGETEGDYYGKNGKWLGTDGKTDDKVYTAESVTKNDKGIVTGGTGIERLKDPKGNYMLHSDFQKIAGKIDGEASGKMETRGIAHAAYNAVKTEGNRWKDMNHYMNIKSSAPEKTILTSDNSTGANEARAALIHALTGGPDPTNGAIRWDGTDLLAWGLNRPKEAGGGAFPKLEAGVIIEGKHLDAYIQAQLKKYSGGTVGYYGKQYKLPADVFLNEKYRVYSYTNAGERKLRFFAYKGTHGYHYYSTAVIGESIFWKIR